MPDFIKSYIRLVERANFYIGHVAMYLVFAMLGVLLFSTFSKLAGSPSLWTLDVAQFVMVAYYLLGGGYSLRQGDHVRMDLLYGRWSPEKKARMDVVTDLALIFFLVMLLIGGISSTVYAVNYGERSFSMWRPYLWPIKIVMTFGVGMTLLQAVAFFFRDIAILRGQPLPEVIPPNSRKARPESLGDQGVFAYQPKMGGAAS